MTNRAIKHKDIVQKEKVYKKYRKMMHFYSGRAFLVTNNNFNYKCKTEGCSGGSIYHKKVDKLNVRLLKCLLKHSWQDYINNKKIVHTNEDGYDMEIEVHMREFDAPLYIRNLGHISEELKFDPIFIYNKPTYDDNEEKE